MHKFSYNYEQYHKDELNRFLSEKRRGGTGVNLAFGIVVAMVYVFFDKIFGVLALQSDLSPIVAVWLPNIIFGLLSVYLVYNAKR